MIARDENTTFDALAIVEKYESFVTYLYPILQNCPSTHRVARDCMLAVLFEPIPHFYAAAKARQVSKLYAADASLATLRSWLRFMVRPKVKAITPKQHRTALAMLAEVGRMLGGWIAFMKREG